MKNIQLNLDLTEVASLKDLLLKQPLSDQQNALLAKIDSAERRATDPALDAYRRAAQAQAREGDIEIDDDAVVSGCGDGGAYVQAWMWVADSEMLC